MAMVSLTQSTGFKTAKATSPIPFWLEVVIYTTVVCYAVFNNGIAQVRIPPNGVGVPLGELVLLLAVFFLVVRSNTVSIFLSSPIGILFAIWWLLTIVGIVFGLPDHGVWAIRSATHAIEAVYIVIGIALGANAASRARFDRFWAILLVTSFIYAATYPIGPELARFSPTVTALAGYSQPVFFGDYAGVAMYTLVFASIVLFQPRGSVGLGTLAFSILAIVVALFFHQNRTSYAFLMLLVIVVAWFNPRSLRYLVLSGVIAIGAIATLVAAGVELPGRLAAITSLDFFAGHFLSSFGIAGEEFAGPANGVSQRFLWWGEIVASLLSDPIKLLFGLGQGVALTDFTTGNDVVVREPHNSLISTFGRYGIVGLAAFLFAHVAMFVQLLTKIATAERLQLHVERQRLLVILFFFGCVWSFSMVEDGLEKPFIAIPYYLLWGYVLSWRPGASGLAR